MNYSKIRSSRSRPNEETLTDTDEDVEHTDFTETEKSKLMSYEPPRVNSSVEPSLGYVQYVDNLRRKKASQAASLDASGSEVEYDIMAQERSGPSRVRVHQLGQEPSTSTSRPVQNGDYSNPRPSLTRYSQDDESTIIGDNNSSLTSRSTNTGSSSRTFSINHRQPHRHNRNHNTRRAEGVAVAAMGSDEDPKEYDRLRQLFKRGLIAAEVTGVTMCLLLIVWTTYYAKGIYFLGSGSPLVINLHVVLMVVFMLYLHGHAALIYRIFPTQPKYTIKLLHATIHLAVCIGTGCGLAAAVEQHNIKGTPHFYSLHSWLGLTAIVLYYGQFLGGFVTFLLPYAPMSLRTSMLPYHRFAGQILFSIATAAAVTGVMLKAIGTIGDDYPNLPATALVLNSAGFLVLTFSVIVGNLLGDHRFRRRARPEGELLLTDTAGGAKDGSSE